MSFSCILIRNVHILLRDCQSSDAGLSRFSFCAERLNLCEIPVMWESAAVNPNSFRCKYQKANASIKRARLHLSWESAFPFRILFATRLPQFHAHHRLFTSFCDMQQSKKASCQTRCRDTMSGTKTLRTCPQRCSRAEIKNKTFPNQISTCDKADHPKMG